MAGASSFSFIGGVDLSKVAALSQIDQTNRRRDTAPAAAALLFAGRTSAGDPIGPGDVFPLTGDGRVGRTIERWHVLEGRRPHPERVDEVMASFLVAQRLGLHVGNTFTLHFFRPDSFLGIAARLLQTFGPNLRARADSAGFAGFARMADGPEVTFRVVGIEASPAEFPPLNADLSPPIHLTPAFARRFGDKLVGSQVLFVRLDGGLARLPGFKAAVERLGGGQPVSFISSRANQTPKVQRALRVQANAIRLLALLVAMAVILVVAQARARQIYAEGADNPVLRALGMTPRGMFVLAMVRTAIVALLGAVLAVLLAFVLSTLMPVGLARRANLQPGLDFDAVVLLPGALLVALSVLLAAVVPARRASRPLPELPNDIRLSGLTRLLAGAALPPSAIIGIRFGLQSVRGTAAVPTRSTIVGVSLAVTMLTGISCFAASLNRLIDTPRLYGWNWELKVGAPALPDIGAQLVPDLRAAPEVGGISAGTVVQIQVADQRVDVLALDRVRGSLVPSIVEGVAPVGRTDIVLGTRTLRAAHLHVGDTVNASFATRTVGMRIVGRGVFPDFGDAGQLGTGALMTYQGLKTLLPTAQENVFLIGFAPGVDKAAATRHVRDALQPLPTRTAQRPPDLSDFARVQGAPGVLAGLLAALAVTTLANTLMTSLRRRRRDLAILKTLGFVRGQVSATVIWHATAVAALALIFGLPLGAAAGRLAWVAVANSLGVVAEPVVPPLPVIVSVPAVILAANLVAAVPAWLASRTRPAPVLRAE